MKIICFGQVSLPAEGFVFQGQSSRSRIPVVAVQVIDLMQTAGPVLCLPCGHQTRKGACAGFTCARPSARALNVQAAGQHLAGISCTHMGTHIWAMVAELVGGGPLPAHSPSFHQAWPSAFAAPGLQPALCLHIPRGSFHQAPGRQRSSIAACPLPAHSPLLLGPSSLPFARLQTPKTPKTPKTLPCLHIALSC